MRIMALAPLRIHIASTASCNYSIFELVLPIRFAACNVNCPRINDVCKAPQHPRDGNVQKFDAQRDLIVKGSLYAKEYTAKR